MIIDFVGTKCYYIWCFKNQEIKCFGDKYLIMLPIEIRNMQIHQHKRTGKKKCQPICRFQYPKPPMKKK